MWKIVFQFTTHNNRSLQAEVLAFTGKSLNVEGFAGRSFRFACGSLSVKGRNVSSPITQYMYIEGTSITGTNKM